MQVYREIIAQAKPEVIVETGSWEGGSAAWFAEFAEVISIDVSLPRHPDPRVHAVIGDSTAPEIASYVRDEVRGRRCLVSLDSDHNAEHVAQEIAAYAPLVTIGSYLVVEDTAVDAYDLEPGSYPEGGPLVAVQHFLKTDNRFVPDPECERFRLGMNPGGWLRRVA